MRPAVFLVAVACSLLVAHGQEPIKPALPVNEEALAKIKQLKPNQAAIIGKATVIGEFNEVAKKYELDRTGPRGRDFTIRMVWAPERNRVLFCGANHGTPHRLNDVWEFDLASMAWIMLYAPDNPRDYTGIGKDFSDVEFKDGILITKRGGPAIIAHTWWGFTYDPEQKQLLFMNTWVTNQKKAVEQLGGDPEQLYAGPPLWAFSPATGKWTMLKTEQPYPRPIFGGMLEYIPELKGSIWHANNWQMHGTWLYEAKPNAWKNLKANEPKGDFEQHSPEPEQVGYYDPKRKLVIVQRHKATHHFDVTRTSGRRCSRSIRTLTKCRMVTTRTPRCTTIQSAATGCSSSSRRTRSGLAILTKHGVDKLKPEGDAMPEGNKRLAYFDHAQNVFVIIHDTTVWSVSVS